MQGPDGQAVVAEPAERDLESTIEHVVEAVDDMRPLRVECAALLVRHRAGAATESDRQRYCTLRLGLLLRESATRRVRLPKSADAVYARRSELVVEALLESEAQVA
jgi:hypothetical protein